MQWLYHCSCNKSHCDLVEALGPHVDMLYKGRAYFISQNNELILINHNRVFFFFLNCILICLTCSISFHVQALNVKFKQ